MTARTLEFGRYGAVSAIALGFDAAMLWVLVKHCRLPYVTAATVSFAAGTIVAYLLSVRFVFRHRRLPDRRAEFASFAALGTAGLAVNAAVMMIATRYLGVYFMLAKILAAAFTFCCNFFARRQFLFVPRRTVEAG